MKRPQAYKQAAGLGPARTGFPGWRRTVMSFGVMLAAWLGWPPGLVGASPFDGTYDGTIHCDALPGASGRLNAPFSLTITTDRVQYEGQIVTRTGEPTGNVERGTGTIQPDGDLVLTGLGLGLGFSYKARYVGQLKGDVIQLTGEQRGRIGPETASSPRSCTIDLRHALP
jgi:hypothetical protein